MTSLEERVDASPDGHCSHEGCEATYKTHYWGKVKAGDAGWFFQKNGDVWCPDHNPEWVAEWRASKPVSERQKGGWKR